MTVNALRDKFTHPKPQKGESYFEYLYKEALDYNYAMALEEVKAFINFYENKPLIEDCPCSHPE